ncbi:CHRD domain-containing protein [Pontibacter ummariensis]|uniref:CHRD domain-containing protein n=1 Tax=Pontibacter ummariensis TaxID=1610492 RepID=A0A239JWK0_9BACT|nr:CHRD domain-containing protein [Pontibacter ummariensis]PRY07292.1 CHRD domain-containing protein [Pontibacter ummariensis]SNT10307.1 CHRD domain-containing protein [Pontibacter ummariensis]
MKSLFHTNILLLLLLSPLCVFSSCDDDDEDDGNINPDIVQFENITLSGDNEVPANSSAATGTFNGTFNRDTKIMTYSIDFAGLTPTMMHFHKAAVGQNGDVEIGIGAAPFTSPVQGQTPALTEAQEADLMAGLWYVNVHSNQFPGGEIRGQLVP